MESDGTRTRTNVTRPIPTGAGGGAGGHGWPGRVSAAPPEIPGLGGDERPPRPVMGSLGRNPSSASQGFVPDVSAAIVAMSETTKKIVLSNSVVKTSGNLNAKVARRAGIVVYGVRDHETVVKLIARLLYNVAKSYKGTTVYLNNRKISALLGLEEGYFDAFSKSWITLLLVSLGFKSESKNKKGIIEIDMRSQVVEEIKTAKSIDDAVEIVKKHLNNGG